MEATAIACVASGASLFDFKEKSVSIAIK